jgi:hypothetical protein
VLLHVFLHPPVAHLHAAQLAFDYAKWMRDRGPDARLEIFELVNKRIDRAVALVPLIALDWAPDYLPAHVLHGVREFFFALVSHIGKNQGFLAASN